MHISKKFQEFMTKILENVQFAMRFGFLKMNMVTLFLK